MTNYINLFGIPLSIVDRDLLEFIDDAVAERLDEGTDSIVYKSYLNNSIIKIYEPLRCGSISVKKGYSVDECMEIVKTYNSDTLKAKNALKSLKGNFLNDGQDICIGGESYSLNVEVVPQGELKIIGNEVVAVGQKFIEGASLKRIQENLEFMCLDNSEKNVFKSVYLFYCSVIQNKEVIYALLDSASNIIKEEIGVSFGGRDDTNIKPVIDKKGRCLNIVITDLASNIAWNYGHKIHKFSLGNLIL